MPSDSVKRPAFVRFLTWLHLVLVAPVVNWWDDWVIHTSEEWFKSVIRECFAQVARFINGVSTLVVSVADGNYRESLRGSWQQQHAWHTWWREERPSTLNAVFDQKINHQGAQRPANGEPHVPLVAFVMLLHKATRVGFIHHNLNCLRRMMLCELY
jgi:hypothetical protein